MKRGVAANVVLLFGKPVGLQHAVRTEAAAGGRFVSGGVRLSADQQIVQERSAQMNYAVVVGAHLVALRLQKRVVALVVANALAQEVNHLGVLAISDVAMIHHEGLQIVHYFRQRQAALKVFLDDVKQNAGARNHNAEILRVSVSVRDFAVEHVLLDVAQKIARIERDVLVQVVNGARADARGFAQQLPVIQVVLVQPRLVHDVDGVQIDARIRHGGLRQHDERLQSERVGRRHGNHVRRHACSGHGSGIQARQAEVVALHDEAAGFQLPPCNHRRFQLPQIVNDRRQVVAHGLADQEIFFVFGGFKRSELGCAQLVHVCGILVAAVFIRGIQLQLIGQRGGHGDLHHIFFWRRQRQRQLFGCACGFIHVCLLANDGHRQNPMQALVQFAQRINERTVIRAVRQRHVRISAAVKLGKLLAQLLEPGDCGVNVV